jgi:hypothetical protein
MAKKKKIKKNKVKKLGFKTLMILFFSALTAIIFTPTSLILLIGMLPTLVAYLVDRSLEKNKTFTIGAMNFAGCFPYLLGLWKSENSLAASLNYLENPETIIFIYSIAALGYVINWLVTMGIATLLRKKSALRLERIEKEKEKLRKRWGDKVNGKYELDGHGFPMLKEDEPEQEASS